MASIRQRHRKELQSEDRDFLALYGMLPGQLEQDPPLFGSGHRLPLANQLKASDDNRYPPTLINLARHFGFECSQEKLEAIHQIDPIAADAREKREVARFYHRVILPVRQYSETRLHVYCYCLGKVEVVTNEKTGLLSIQTSGERVLTYLPDSVDSAVGYRIHENTIKLLAPQVIHVLSNQLGRGSVRDVKSLHSKRDGWFELVDPSIKKQFLAGMVISAPCLASQRSVKQLRLI